MARVLVLGPLGCLALGLAAGCGGGADASAKTMHAVINAGTAVAAMPIHQAITGCVTQCGYGTGCDEQTGLCVSLEELAKQGRAKPATASTDPAPATAVSQDLPFDDTCAGLCLSDERCVMYRGELDCVRR